MYSILPVWPPVWPPVRQGGEMWTTDYLRALEPLYHWHHVPTRRTPISGRPESAMGGPRAARGRTVWNSGGGGSDGGGPTNRRLRALARPYTFRHPLLLPGAHPAPEKGARKHCASTHLAPAVSRVSDESSFSDRAVAPELDVWMYSTFERPFRVLGARPVGGWRIV